MPSIKQCKSIAEVARFVCADNAGDVLHILTLRDRETLLERMKVLNQVKSQLQAMVKQIDTQCVEIIQELEIV